MLLRCQTSKLRPTSTATHKNAPKASKKRRWLRDVIANEPWAAVCTYPATNRWQKHHVSRSDWLFVKDARISLNVGMGRDGGS